MAVAGLALALLFASWTGRVLVQAPMARLLATITAWRSGNETVRSGMTERQGELGVVGSAIDSYMDRLIEDRKARQLAEEHRELLLRELDHRVKNILATVQAIARQTFRDGTDPNEATDVFGARLGAIASAHSLLTSNAWQSTNVTEVVATAIRPFRSESGSGFTVSGPSLVICAKVALALSMALHELCTNSVKYGALSCDSGRVTIRWTIVDPAGDQRLRFEWIETGGPPVVAPARRGFGSRMIERLLAAEIDGTIDLAFPTTGVTCTIDAPLATILAPDSPAAAVPSPPAHPPAASGTAHEPPGESGNGPVSPSPAREISSTP
jgi:two-component sensor histidine kinase